MTGKNAHSHLTDVIAGAFLIFFGSAALVVRLDLFQVAVLSSPLLTAACPIVFIAFGAVLWMLEDPVQHPCATKADGRESTGVNYGK